MGVTIYNFPKVTSESCSSGSNSGYTNVSHKNSVCQGVDDIEGKGAFL